jgi:hypothetical protein
MSLTRDELSPKFMLAKETCHAAPARGEHTGLRAFRATRFGARLAPCASATPRGDADARGSHGDGGLAGDGAGYATPLHQFPIRLVIVADPEGKLRLAAVFCTDLQATPVEILPWVVMRWSVEVTFEEARAHLGLETQRQWSDLAIARTTPVLLALFSLVTGLALPRSEDTQLPVPATAWYHKGEPTFADCLAWVRGHRWRAR